MWSRRGDEPRWLSGAPAPTWLRWLPVVLLVFIPLLQLLVDRPVDLGFLLGAIPPLATLAYGPFGTAVFSAAVLVLLNISTINLDRPGRGDVIAVTFVAVLSVAISWMRRRRAVQITTIRTVAEAAQLAVLPPLPPRVDVVRCAGLYRPAQRGTLVGGDFFDVRRGPYGVRALVGDVQGHGIAAVGTVTSILGAFREAVLDEEDLADVAARLDRRLVVDAADAAAGAITVARVPEGDPDSVVGEPPVGQRSDPTSGELFATALLLEFRPGSGEVGVVSCGHPAPVLLRGATAHEIEVQPAPPLGLGFAGSDRPVERDVRLQPGDRVLAVTDGVTEARNDAEVFYPLVDRAAQLAAEDPGELIAAIWRDLVGYARTIDDDVALLVFAPDPEGEEPDTGTVTGEVLESRESGGKENRGES
ncbi:Membrane protein OS=Streptomyces gougerotii OX=53448 GN=GCM10010227_11320 PE=4 SV=1 [Streptomyces diastaticus subsp. diastaticus]|nr:membrane protein [Streptomyces diastaticus subsp. diastaticus]